MFKIAEPLLADLALTFSTFSADDLEVIASIAQTIYVIMPEDHPLSRRRRLRLNHCAEYALALNDGSYAIRNMLDAEARRSNILLRPAVETDSYILLHNYILSGHAIGFEIEIGLPEKLPKGLVRRRLDLTVSNERSVHLAQLRGRTLPVSAAKFAEQVNAEFQRIGSD